MIFETKWTHREQGPQMEDFTGQVSLTQPDEVMSIKEMLARHARGLPVQGHAEHGVYLDESLGYVPDPKELDLVEIKEWSDKFSARLKELKKIEDDAKSKAKEDADFKRFKNKLEKEKANDPVDSPPPASPTPPKGESA